MSQGDVARRRTPADERLLAPPFDAPLIVLSNRAPIRHEHADDGAVRRHRSGGGLVTAIEPVLSTLSGTWIARGERADLDAAAAHQHVSIAAGRSAYRLRYVDMAQSTYDGYYNGFANEALWPLCHSTAVRPVFRSSDYRDYAAANVRFADAVSDESAGRVPLVFVQDYHLALAPRFIRQRLPDSAIVSFWHIPWPAAHVFLSCPWARQLAEGLLGSDIIGVQTERDCTNLLNAMTLLVDGVVDHGRRVVHFRGRSIAVRVYPVGVEWDPACLHELPDPSGCREQVLRDRSLPARVLLGVGVDRMDYTKGIAGKFLAIERMLESRPDLRGRFVFIQVAEPSRQALPAYRESREHAVEVCARVNARFGTPECCPIVMHEHHVDPKEVYRLYRAADFCFVNSLHDGMNLVAKEFVSARSDERGVLVLSERAGAARQLAGALTVNPYAIERSARTLARALAMDDAEQRTRMCAMRSVVESTDCSWWTAAILEDVLRFRRDVTVTAAATVA